MLLPRAQFAGADEADALAIAICHANHRLAVGTLARGMRLAAAGHGQAPGRGDGGRR
jgi:crossover junction endodeoxyribonuclease RuvC